MKNNILVSIIVPVYNVEPYIDRCIRSVINQTEKEIELILIDDGSRDKSGEICDKYAKMDYRIKVFHQSNKGRCIARNVGLKNASGEWILFLDSDDWVEPDFVKVMLHVYEQTGSNIISCKTQIWVGDRIDKRNEDLDKVSTYYLEDIVKGLLTQEVIRFELWNKLIKRELLDDIEFLSGQLSEEVHIDRLIFLRTNSLSHIDKTLHNYLTQRPGNTTSKFNYARISIFSEFDEFVADLRNIGRDDLAEVVQCIAMQFVILIYMEALEHKQNDEVKLELKEYEKKYYEKANKSKYYLSHVGLKIFRLSPRLYFYIINYKKRRMFMSKGK